MFKDDPDGSEWSFCDFFVNLSWVIPQESHGKSTMFVSYPHFPMALPMVFFWLAHVPIVFFLRVFKVFPCFINRLSHALSLYGIGPIWWVFSWFPPWFSDQTAWLPHAGRGGEGLRPFPRSAGPEPGPQLPHGRRGGPGMAVEGTPLEGLQMENWRNDEKLGEIWWKMELNMENSMWNMVKYGE